MMFSVSIVALLAYSSTIVAQSFSECDPKKGCFRKIPGTKDTVIEAFFSGASKFPAGWTKGKAYGSVEFGDNGLGLVLGKHKDSPKAVSDFTILFGSVEVKAKAAPGKGIISSIVLMSHTLDEFDWEWGGTFPNEVQENYYGKGNDKDSTHGGSHPMASSVLDDWHTYKFDWTPDATTFSIDGKPVRTLLPSESSLGGGYPQTPCRIYFSLWAGGDPDNRQGTKEWAGGETDYSKGPFKMWIDSVKIINYTPADSYEYTDKSATLESIQINGGTLMSNGPAGGKLGNIENKPALASSLPESLSPKQIQTVSSSLASLASPTSVNFTSLPTLAPISVSTTMSDRATPSGLSNQTNTTAGLQKKKSEGSPVWSSISSSWVIGLIVVLVAVYTL